MRLALQLVLLSIFTAALAVFHFLAFFIVAALTMGENFSDWEWPLAGLCLLSFIFTATFSMSWLTRKVH